MNILPLLIILLSFLGSRGGKSSQISDMLKNINTESLSPVFNLLGIDSSVINVISSDAFKNALNGNFDLSSIISLITPLLSDFTAKKQGFETQNVSKPDNYPKLSPIKDIAGEGIYNSLNGYFSH